MATTRKLAHFVTDLQFSDLPDSVVQQAKSIVLNSFGVQMAASTLPWSKLFYRYGRSQGGVPESTVVNYGLRTSAGNAAFINGCFGHGFEMDDIHPVAAVKGGCVTVPPALAIGEQQLSSGKDFITALVAGYEVIIRAVFAARPGLNRGYQSTGTCGGFGSAAIAGKLLGLDEATITNALAIATSHNSAITQGRLTVNDKGYMKRTFGGMANVSGIRAAQLAKEGLTATETTLDADSGFAHIFDVADDKISLFTDGLGSDWEILNGQFKIYAQDGHIQPVSECLERIRKAHQFDTEDIDQVIVGTHRLALEEVIGRIRDPKDLTDAQYSANFSVALYLVKGGAGFHEYTDENLSDPVIRELSQRVVLEIDDELEAAWQKSRPRNAKVTIRLKSGEEFKEHVVSLRMMTVPELDDKFRELSTVIVDRGRSERLLDMVRNIEDVRDISTLVPLLVR